MCFGCFPSRQWASAPNLGGTPCRRSRDGVTLAGMWIPRVSTTRQDHIPRHRRSAVTGQRHGDRRGQLGSVHTSRHDKGAFSDE